MNKNIDLEKRRDVKIKIEEAKIDRIETAMTEETGEVKVSSFLFTFFFFFVKHSIKL